LFKLKLSLLTFFSLCSLNSYANEAVIHQSEYMKDVVMLLTTGETDSYPVFLACNRGTLPKNHISFTVSFDPLEEVKEEDYVGFTNVRFTEGDNIDNILTSYNVDIDAGEVTYDYELAFDKTTGKVARGSDFFNKLQSSYFEIDELLRKSKSYTLIVSSKYGSGVVVIKSIREKIPEYEKKCGNL
jgi:hypothetical protein